ncbi:MAG: hypothetical protein ACR2QU_06380, partial [Gammaproteobacteria bacterium]
MRTAPLVATTVLLAVCGCDARVHSADHQKITAEVTRPDFSFASTEAFDPAEVPVYEGMHVETYSYIDDHIDEHIAGLQRWVRQPSISAQDVGIQTMAEMVRDDMRALGFAEAELVPTSGHPGVWGYYDAGADKTLLL